MSAHSKSRTYTDETAATTDAQPASFAEDSRDVSGLERLKEPPHKLHILLRRRPLTGPPSYEPHGFESFGARRVLASSGDLAVANGVDDGIAHVYRDTVALPHATRVLDRHDLISRLDELFGLVTGVLEHLHPLAEVAPHRFLSREDANVVGRTLDCPPV